MKRIALVPIPGILVLAACATPSPASPDQARADGNDCAVIAAVAREHYRFNMTDNVPPPLWLDGEGADWKPACDWTRYDLVFPQTYDPDAPAPIEDGRPRVQWVSFEPPRYDGQGAMIEAGILHGPLAGMGVGRRVRSGVAGWTVQECRNTWIS